jgi:hypothetical protein
MTKNEISREIERQSQIINISDCVMNIADKDRKSYNKP